MRLEPGTQIGSYEILATIGTGGMGVVYKAIDRRLNRPVAIKALTRSSATGEQPWDEAWAVASLDHPYICKIYEVIETDHGSLIVLEFVEGETLAAVLKNGPLSAARAARIGAEIAEGLANAHARGLVHRDIKPANVMLTSHGHIKLLDFGLARRDVIKSPLDTTGLASVALPSRAGTPTYMAPEQALGEPVTAKADLFSLGVVLFECLTQTLPFSGATTLAYLNAMVSAPSKPLSDLAPEAPAVMVDLVNRCLAKAPADRPDSTAGVAATLRTIAEGSSSQAFDAAGVRRAAWPPRAFTVAMAAVALSAVVTATLVWRSVDRTVAPTEHQSLPLITAWPSRQFGSRISPDGQWVSWLASPKGPTEVFVRAVAGGDTHALQVPNGDVLSQTWSPDGREIACVVKTSDHFFLQIVPSVLGGAPVQSISLPLQTNGYLRALRWVSRTIFLEAESSGKVLYRIDLDRATTDNLSATWPVAGTLGGFDVSVDGRAVVFVLDRDNQSDLWMAAPDGSAAKRLTNDQFFKKNPIFVGPGRRIVFQSNRGGQRELWELDADSGHLTGLTSGEAEDIPESASADGTAITFQRTTSTASLFAASMTSAPSHQLTSDALSDSSPTISRDGRVVAFKRAHAVASDPSDMTGVGQLMVAGIHDGALTSEPQGVASGFYPQLSPDATKLAFLTSQPSGATALNLTDLNTRVSIPIADRCLPPDFSPMPRDWASQNVAWSDDGETLYYVSRQGPGAPTTLRAYDVASKTGRDIAITAAGQSIIDVYPAPDRERVAYLMRPGGRAVDLMVYDRRSQAAARIAHFDGQVSFRGWRNNAALVLGVSTGAANPDGSKTLELVEVSVNGGARTLAHLDRVFRSTIRLDPARDVAYVTGAESALENLFATRLADGVMKALTDNRTLGVTFSGALTLGGSSVIYVRAERREEIWLLRTAR